MLCRQVLPDTDDGIEQIYIVKSEPGMDSGDCPGQPQMVPEDVDQIKQEALSDDEEEQPAGNSNAGLLDVIIKEEEPESERGRGRTVQEPEEQDVTSSQDGSGFSSSDESDDSYRSDSSEEEPKVRKKRPYNRRPKPPDGSTPIKKQIFKRFVCHYCPKKFSTLFNLERHEKGHDPDLEKQIQKKNNNCFICEKEHDCKEELHEHLCLHADMLPYNCTECEKPVRVVSVRLLNKHYQLHKEIETGIIKCMHCPARFHSLSGCRQHERGHIEGLRTEEAEARAELESKRLNVKVIIVDGLKRYECEYCGKSYSLLATLRRHTNSHTMEKAYVCKICGKVFNKASSLTLHEKVHSDVKPYKCETCGKGFKETIRLIEHRRIHTGEKPFVCHCGMAFRKKHILREHKQLCEIQEDTEPTSCRFCQQPFPGYSSMMAHVKQVHAPGMVETKCNLCMAKFKDAVLLVIHEHRHELPNVIKCEQCNRIFKYQSNLQRHMKVHENTSKSCMCDVCGKTFSQNVNLRIHRRIHSGKRPHLCDLCPKTFYCSSTMRRHRLTHFKGNSKNFIATSLEEDNAATEQCEMQAAAMGDNIV